jgi:hypothetical protein
VRRGLSFSVRRGSLGRVVGEWFGVRCGRFDKHSLGCAASPTTRPNRCGVVGEGVGYAVWWVMTAVGTGFNVKR